MFCQINSVNVSLSNLMLYNTSISHKLPYYIDHGHDICAKNITFFYSIQLLRYKNTRVPRIKIRFVIIKPTSKQKIYIKYTRDREKPQNLSKPSVMHFHLILFFLLMSPISSHPILLFLLHLT